MDLDSILTNLEIHCPNKHPLQIEIDVQKHDDTCDPEIRLLCQNSCEYHNLSEPSSKYNTVVIGYETSS